MLQNESYNRVILFFTFTNMCVKKKKKNHVYSNCLQEVERLLLRLFATGGQPEHF